MKLKIPILLALALFVILACSDKSGISKSLFESTVTGDSVSMAIFTGKLSSESRSNMPVVIKLMRNNTFKAEASDLKTGEIFRSTGRYQTEKGMIVLQPEEESFLPLQYTFSDNKLIILNKEKSPADEVFFEKLNNDLLEKYWKLEEIMGKPVHSAARVPYIIFRYINNSAAGNSGCNGFSSTFQILKNNTISFTPVMSTKMACVDIDYENEFFRLLENANRFEINSDSLILKTDTAIVLKFSKTDEESVSR